MGNNTTCFLVKSCGRICKVSSGSRWSALRKAFHRQTPPGRLHYWWAGCTTRPQTRRTPAETRHLAATHWRAQHMPLWRGSKPEASSIQQRHRGRTTDVIQPQLMTITLSYYVSWSDQRNYQLRVAEGCQWVVLSSVFAFNCSDVFERLIWSKMVAIPFRSQSKNFKFILRQTFNKINWFAVTGLATFFIFKSWGYSRISLGIGITLKRPIFGATSLLV